MPFFTDLYGSLLGMWTALTRSYTTFQLVLISWAVWIAMPIAIQMVWIAITTMWMVITTMWTTITSMCMTITTSYDPLDLAFKLWLSIMTFLIFRMGANYFRQLDLHHIRSQEELNNLHSDLSNMQHCLNTDMNRFADCLKHQMHIENKRYEELRSLILENNRAQVASNRVKKLKDALINLQTLKDSAVKELNELADDLDKHFSRIKIAKTAGQAASIGGGIIMIAGLALVPITFGTSVILSIVGGAISGAGGATAGGSTVADLIISHKKRKSAKKVLDDYNSAIKNIKEECLAIGNILKENSINMETERESWCKFWGKFVLGTSTTSRISWNAIANPILLSFRLAAAGEDVATLGVRGVMMAGKVPVIGSIVGILMIPLDIYFLVDVAIDVHNNTPHKDSNGIRKLAAELNNNCPTEQEIKNMIEATFQPGTISTLESFV